MSAGPLHYTSAIPVEPNHVFPRIHNGDDGLGLTDATTLTADAIWRLRFPLPPEIPAGLDMKLVVKGMSDETSGAVPINPKWASVPDEEDPDAATLNVEGASTLTWGAGDAGVYKGMKITLDGGTPVGGEVIAMDLTFEDSGMTLGGESMYLVWIIFE